MAMRLTRFSFVYRTTDGRSWCDFVESPDWQSALDAVQDLQGHQCGAVCAVIDVDSGEQTHAADPPDCPPHLVTHPAGRMTL